MATNLGLDLNFPWERILADGTFEMRDPNSGLGFDAATKPRFQYRVDRYTHIRYTHILVERKLPPEDVGDRWLDDDIDDPWWEIVHHVSPVPDNPITRFWEAVTGEPAYKLALAAAHMRHVIAYTPSGRYVMREDDGQIVVQPHNDNYIITVPDLRAARRAYFHPYDWEE